MDAGLSEEFKEIEKKVNLLEARVFGKRCDHQINLIDSLEKIIGKLCAIATGKEKYQQLVKKLEELSPFIDNLDLVDDNCEPDLVKMELILSQENHIKEKSDMINQIMANQKLVDSFHFDDTNKLRSKYNDCKLITIKQNERFSKMNQEFFELLNNYNQAMKAIKDNLVTWDKILSRLEDERAQKKSWTKQS